jgi:hypothetical protein
VQPATAAAAFRRAFAREQSSRREVTLRILRQEYRLVVGDTEDLGLDLFSDQGDLRRRDMSLNSLHRT